MDAADSSEKLANVFHFIFTAVRASKVRPCSAPNKTAKVPPRHAAYRPYAGIFLRSKCHIVSRYNRKCNFTDVQEKSTAFPAPIFKKLTNSRQQEVQIFPYYFIQIGQQRVKFGYTFIERPLKKMWLSFRCVDFTRNSQSSKKLLWNSPPPNFTQTGRRMWNMWAKFLRRPQVNKSFHCTDFHEDPNCSTALRTLPTHLAQIGKEVWK